MATINLNSIQDFFETGISYCSSKFREIIPIVPYSFISLKQMIYSFTKVDELVTINNKSHKSYLKNIPDYALADMDIDFENMRQHNYQATAINNGIYYIVLADLVGSGKP